MRTYVWTMVAAAGMAAPATAATVVNWGGNMVGTTARGLTGITTGTEGTTNYRRIAFSDSSAMSPATGYTGGPFYGGFNVTSVGSAITTSSGWNAVAVHPSDPTTFSDDALRLSFTTGANSTASEVAGVVLFNTAAPAFLGAGSTFSLTPWSADNGNATGRFVLQSGNSYYISAASFTYTNTPYATPTATTLTLAANTPFYVYTPASSLNFDQLNPGTATTPNFSSVTALGFYFERDLFTTGASSSTTSIRVRSFSVDVVPEPAALGLLAGSGLLLGSRRRQR